MVWLLPFLKSIPVLLSLLSGIGAWIFSGLAGADFAVTICLLFMAAAFAYGVISFLCRTPLRFVPFLRTLRNILRLLLLVGLIGFGVLLGQALSGGHSDPEPARVDAILVLGAGVRGETPSAVFAARLDACVAYAEKHPGVPIVLTGGQGPDEGIAESVAAYRYLTARGIDAKRLQCEETSTNTVENIENAEPLLGDAHTVAVVSSDYHLYRARKLLRDAGYEPVAVSAPAPYAYLTVVGYLREVFSLLFMWVAP